MKCQACGNDNPANSGFCGMCGASFSVSTSGDIGAALSELPMVSFIDAVKLGSAEDLQGRNTGGGRYLS